MNGKIDSSQPPRSEVPVSGDMLNRRSFLAHSAMGVTGVAALGGISAVAWNLLKETPATDAHAMLMYLAQPGFSGKHLMPQLLGQSELQRFSPKTGKAYFSTPTRAFTANEHHAILHRPDAIETGEPSGSIGQKIGDLRLNIPSTIKVFWCTSTENFKVDPTRKLSFTFPRVEYGITVSELAAYFRGEVQHGGKAYISHVGAGANSSHVTANHGVKVSIPGEPSMQRLAQEIFKNAGLSESASSEEKIQSLLDFVTTQLPYSIKEAEMNAEVIKSANEVLMTGGSDCSGKTILLASLIEQVGRDYLLVYLDGRKRGGGHITVAVEQGNFEDRNEHSFEWDGKRWLLAESTARGFVIGASAVDIDLSSQSLDFLQRPRERNVVHDCRAGIPAAVK